MENRRCSPALFAEVRPTDLLVRLQRVGAVVVAGCRDHQAARQLGFVPTHGVAPALEMAHGRAGGSARLGVLLAPPYFPLEVGSG